MKLNKIMLAAVMAFGVSSLAHAANQGGGTVTFSGSIIDAPCSITPESLDQSVDLGAISNVSLKNGSKTSIPRDFHIQLEGCDLKTEAPGKNNTVTLTFNGTASATDKKLLAITGEAKGAGIAITDANKNLIELGKASNAIELQNGRNKLSFTAYLQGSSAADATIVPGDFQAVADFTLAYQ